MAALTLVAYFGVLTLLALSGLHRLHLTFHALRGRRKDADAAMRPDSGRATAVPDSARATAVPDSARAAPVPGSAWPVVLVQLPMFNEAFVAERVIRAAAAMRYPSDRLKIQVLDDSTDSTVALVNRVVADLQAEGCPVEVVRRPDRVGFKAGALAYGIKKDDSEFVAIFDADFVPRPDFLQRLVPRLMADEALGLVQARWTHLNRDASLLTRAQGIFLDGHFSVEHAGRDAAGLFFNFNGTAGIWRRAAIEEAGGWRADTITEDLDLSYRAQLAGWRFQYEHDVVAPAELPESWAAFRSQQARWVRGSVETARLLVPQVVRARGLSLLQRSEALVHLTNNFAYLFMAALAVLLPVAVVLRDQLGWRVPGGQGLLSGLDVTMLIAGTFAMIVFYGVAAYRCRAGWRIGDLLYALCLGCGMSLANAVEVVRGFRSRRSEFVRTPKQGTADGPTKARPQYRSKVKVDVLALELLMTVYYLAVTAYALYFALWGALPFVVMYLVGFFSVSVATALESTIRGQAPVSVSAGNEVSSA